ncbi:alpha-(1,4)-fucosyltransferase [Senna tora]|uniref:Fucosyltransferase n=1 Tax=Senna tora TaxID=362788 RepID=A0A834TFB2_9FABA|nr:alpha-(1,4)-fucosyltransferase [Senna tora]
MRRPFCPSKLTTTANLLCFVLFILFLSGILELPSSSYYYNFSSSLQQAFRWDNNNTNISISHRRDYGFTDLVGAFREWDSQVGCARFKQRHSVLSNASSSSSLQELKRGITEKKKMEHVKVLVKKWKWLPDRLENLYYCGGSGITCLWTKSPLLADTPDALFFENSLPPLQRKIGEPLRVYMDLEAPRKRTGREDIFIGYDAQDDIQTTYAGAFFHNDRNYHIASTKNSAPLVYWSSSHCVSQRNKIAHKLLSMLSHHSFGKCLNNVNGRNKALSFYPHCSSSSSSSSSSSPKWWDHLHCAMSHYKFVLAIENTWTHSYVTEKLFYALDSGSVPIYFGAPNVEDFVPPHSVIDGTKFGTLEDLASYVKALANDSLAYAEYHAWRRCGVLGNYGTTRGLSLDTLPCRLCELVGTKGGRNASTSVI